MYVRRQDQVFLADGHLSVLILLGRGDVDHQIFRVEHQGLGRGLASAQMKERDLVGALLKISDLIQFWNILQLLNGGLNLNLNRFLTLNIMLNLANLRLQILQHRGLLNNIISKLLPFHIPIAIDINLIKQKCQIPNQ